MPFLFTRCNVTDYVTHQYDQVKKENRTTLHVFLQYPEERYNSFYSSKKEFVKDVHQNGTVTYRVFDQLKMTPDSYPLSDTLYIILNNSLAWPIVMKQVSTSVFHNTQTQTEQVVKNDSTQATVVSGITQNEYKNIQFQYTLSPKQINALRNIGSVAFRYYAGPETITLKLPNSTLRKLKKLIATN
jgi:hypothetical protein